MRRCSSPVKHAVSSTPPSQGLYHPVSTTPLSRTPPSSDRLLRRRRPPRGAPLPFPPQHLRGGHTPSRTNGPCPLGSAWRGGEGSSRDDDLSRAGAPPRSPPGPPTPGFSRPGGGFHPASTRPRVRELPRRPRRPGLGHTLQWSRTPSRGGAAATLASPLPLSRPLLLVAASVGVVLGRLARAACRGANGHRAAPLLGEPSCPPPPSPPPSLCA